MNVEPIQSISVKELHELSQKQPVELIDVRTPEEFREVRAAIARSVPMDTIIIHELLRNRTGTVDAPLFFICQMGGRSGRVCEAFSAAGYKNVINVVGGTDAWIAAGLPIVSAR
jgi:rhodanese-related sulfurtransferase